VNTDNNSLLIHIRKLTDAHMASRQDDEPLIDRFVRRHDEAAFEALMRRHGPMVFRVCRRILGHAQDAEDAFQATFLLLSHKAASLRDRGSVGPWLFGVATRLARKARVAANRRAAHELRAQFRTQMGADPSLAETQALLDEELAMLPEKYRSVLILCYIQGLTRDQVADRLGLSLAGVKKRLERGRELLHSRLARRGIQITALAFSLLLAGEGMAAVPSALATATLEAALGLAIGKPITALGVSAGVIELYKGSLTAMILSKVKIAAVLALVTLVAVSSVGFSYYTATPNRSDRAERRAPAPARDPQKKPEAEKGHTVPAGLPLELHIVGKNSFALDPDGLTAEQLKEKIHGGPVVFRQPEVNLRLEVTNTGKTPIKLQVPTDTPPTHLTLDLQGPGTKEVPMIQRRLPLRGRGGFGGAAQATREITVAAGESVTLLELPRLQYKNSKGGKFVYWTDPGDYTLVAEFGVSVSPAPAGVVADADGYGPATLHSPKFKFKVEAPAK
jgi:RNA polymerase sigma factor (sigma-70 family)